MCLRRDSRFKRLISYWLCAYIAFFSFPRMASANPVLIAALAVEVPAVSELFGVLTSYLLYGAATTTVTATAVGISVELSRMSPTTGEALKADGAETAMGLLVAQNIVALRDLEVDKYREGQLKILTDELPPEIAADALAKYGAPSRFNPIPVYEYYENQTFRYPVPSPSEIGVGLTHSIVAPYQFNVMGVLSSEDVGDLGNDAYGGKAEELLAYLLTFPSFMAGEYQWSYNDYVKLFSAGKEGFRCVEPTVDSNYRYEPISREPYVKKPIELRVSNSVNTVPVMVEKTLVYLPLSSQGLFVIPGGTYRCAYSRTPRYKPLPSGVVSLVYTTPNVFFRVPLTPQTRFIDKNQIAIDEGLEEKRRKIVLASPGGQTSDLTLIYRGKTLSPAKLAQLYNRAWEQASSRANYQGLRFDASRAVTAQMVQDIRDVRRLDLSLADAMTYPLNLEGTREWDIPIYHQISNTYVSVIEANQEIKFDWGEGVDIPFPNLDTQLDLSAILNSFKWLSSIQLPVRQTTCPTITLDIDYFNYHGVMNSHCTLLTTYDKTVESFLTIFWVALGLFIVFRRR